MRARDLLPQIRRQISTGESADDVASMIQTLANVRAEARETSPEEEIGPAGKILCIIFDLFKTSGYRSYVEGLRLQFSGVASDPTIRSRFATALPPSFLRDEPADIFKKYAAYANEPAARVVRTRADLVDAVADVYALDIDKLRRMFDASARVLQLRFRLGHVDSYEVMERIFRVALREQRRISNVYGWILGAAVHLGASWVPPSKKHQTTLEELIRGVDDDEPEADVLLAE